MKGVTREEVQQVAQEMFQPSQAAAAILGNLNGFRLTPPTSPSDSCLVYNPVNETGGET
jgi:hypothetical protein